MMYKHSDLTDQIIKAFYLVYNTLGFGFLEKVYENAMHIELQKIGLKVKQQQRLLVFYDNIEVGEYYADLVVNDVIVIELKAAEKIISAHENQLINYLKASKMEIGLLLNFGRIPEFKRKIYTNSYKKKLLNG